MPLKLSQTFGTAALLVATELVGVAAGFALSRFETARKLRPEPRLAVDTVNCTVSLRLPFPSKLEKVEYRYTLNEAAFTYRDGATETRRMIWLTPGDTQTGKNWAEKLPAYCTMNTEFAAPPQKTSIP